ncbi:MAG: alpha-2-macroglobulin, partial [Bacteroidaceae bacterium]|nr:alpha-2-macroglobulin [Bacteroidaceae bacterium]
GDGATLHTAFVKEGRPYTNSQKLYRPMPERTLKWEWLSFRDRLRPGQQETWTLRVTRPDGTPAPAQLMATLYDASLDAIAPHSWHLLMDRFWNITALNWTARQLYVNNSSYYAITFPLREYRVHDMRFDTFAETWFHGLGFAYGMEEHMLYDAMPAPMAMREPRMAKAANATMLREEALPTSADDDERVEEEEAAAGATSAIGAPPADVQLRSDFAETAAFMPRLQTDADGVVALAFTLPESLTTWQLMALAHTTDMMSATIRAQATARKDFMAQLALPRFLRSGDKASLRATVQNLTERTLNGTATLEVFDPETEKVVLRSNAPFTAEANGEALLTFDYTPTELPSVVAVRLIATAGKHSDGEQRYLPILPSSTWVTESVEIRADSLGTFTTDLTPLFNHDSPTATQRQLTVEYTTHPIWYALQALPSLRTPQSDDVVSLGAALCAEALAAHIANTTPRLRTLVELWRQEQAQGQPALASRLAQDEELKQIILDETPWLREAENDADRKARLIDLLDAAQQHSTLTDLAARLRQLQAADGGFPWFPGMMSSPAMTHVVLLTLAQHRQLTDDFATLPADVRADINAIIDQG